MKPNVIFKDLAKIEYATAWDYQESLLKENIDIKAQFYKEAAVGDAYSAATQSYLLFCEHPSVYTLGKSGFESHLLLNDARLKELQVSFYKTNRGGDITYHGPGQLVAYPIFDLDYFFTDLGKYMRFLEEVVIKTIAHFGIKGERLEGATGVWIDASEPSKARKICAMGVKCSRWITMHGLALNVNTDLNYFNYIVPCGIVDKGVTSIAKELNGEVIDEKLVKDLTKQAFEEVFALTLIHQ
jgi:lipoyl(octanoyl) transferase